MKQSHYNHYFESGEYTYWYNALHNSYFRLPLKIGTKLHDYLQINTDLSDISTKLNQKFIEKGFLIEEDVDEVNMIRKKYFEAINRKNAFLVILPTLNCNYNCWYCIQDHVVSKMSDYTKDAILRHVDYMINVEKIESLQLNWFGDEPFMYFRDVILPLSKDIMQKCKDAEISFINAATNAYFLTSEITQQFAEIHLLHFQITLDGSKENHDKVKFMKGLHSSFDRALDNIRNMMLQNSDILLTLRINYTIDNLSMNIVNEVCDRIPHEIRNRITILPKKVWQEKPSEQLEKMLKPILKRFIDEGFHLNLWEPVSDFMPCYVSSKYYKSINYNGFVLKCTACNDLHRSAPRGTIADDGSIIWEKNFDKLHSEPTFENGNCLKCNKLPACMGGCSQKRIDNSVGCTYDNNEIRFKTSIISFIDEQYRRHGI